MYPVCNYTGPVNTWSLSLDSFGKTQAFFPAVPGCCNNIIETSFPGKPRTFLHQLFQQLSDQNQTLNSYLRVLQKPKEYTGLPNSQVSLMVERDPPMVGHITGVQKYINCSDGKNLVQEKQHFGGLSNLAVLGIILGSILGLPCIAGGILYYFKEIRNRSYSRL